MSTTPSSTTPSKLSTLEVFLNFVKHPGTSTGLGLALAGLAQFTAAVPVHDRTAPTVLGLGYALATQILDKFSTK